ncbi:MAG: DNA polymerase III subunit delta [Clostridiales bacterium]|nr:DNA polymerase III subunit delta [Clostridiales bacterium]
MNYLDILKLSKTKSLKSAYLMVNRENYLYDHTIQRIKKDYLNPELIVFNYGYYDGAEVDYNQVYNGIITLPVMSEYKIVEIKNLDQMNLTDDQIDNLIDVSHKAIGSVNIITFKNKMSKVYKRFKKAEIEVVEFEKLDGSDFRKWVIKKFRDNGKKLSNQSLEFFINYSMYNDRNQSISLYQMENEIVKISSLPYKMIDIENLKEIMVMPLEMNVFALTDSLADGDIKASFKKLHELLKKGHSTYEIMPLLTKQYNNMLIAKTLSLKSHPINDIQEILGFKSSYPVKLILKRVNGLDKKSLTKSLESCIEYESVSKSQGVNKRAHIESLFMKLTSKK